MRWSFNRALPSSGRYRFWILSLGLGLALISCRQQASTPQNTSSQETLLAAAETPSTIQPIMLPVLTTLEASAQTQLSEQHDHVQALIEAGNTPDAELGEAYGTLGQLLLAYDLKEAAEPALINASLLLPNNREWPYYLAYLYQGNNQLEHAATQYRRVLDLHPEHVPTRVHLAEVYRDLGHEEEAKQILRQTVEIDPRAAAAYFLLGQLSDPTETSEAIRYYETALRLQPNASVVRYPLGLAYQREGNLELSRQHLARRGEARFGLPDSLLLQLDLLKEGTATKLFRGSRLTTQGRHQEALDLFWEALEADPNNAESYMHLGTTHAKLGEYDEAIAAFEEALRLDPAKGKAHYYLGVIIGGQGDEEQALEHFQAAVAADSTDHLAHFALAKIWWRKRECAQVLPHYNAFLVVNPGNTETRIHQAVCYVNVGQYAEARSLLEAGLNALPQHPGLQDALARVLAASNDPTVRDGQRALTMADALAASMPRTETLESLAMAYAEVGRFPEAIQVQQATIKAAQQQNLATWLPHLNTNLSRYQQGQPCRTPWAAVIFEK